MTNSELGPAVTSAVKALVAAYKNASSIIENIKEQRMARGASPPSDELEEALQEGHWEIENIQAKGVQRFGATFEQGDDIAYRALRDLTIDAQSSFLTLAGRDDGTINFEACLDSAISTRLRAVNFLNELYLRQQKSARLSAASGSAASGAASATSGSAVSQRSSIATTIPESPLEPSDGMKEVVQNSPRKPSMQRSVTLESTSSGRPASERSSGSIKLTRKSSWGVFKMLGRSPSVEQRADLVSPLSPQVPGSYLDAQTPAISPVTTAMLSPNLRPTTATLPPAQVITPPISPIFKTSSLDVLVAAGFCKGAYYIQQGVFAKGIQLSTKNMEWTCHCRKCPFAIPADSQNGRPRFDDRAHSTKQLRWRSLLLFKSHLSCSQKKKRVYKCLMCVLLRNGSDTYESEHDLFDHMISHQGGVSNGVELWGPLCLEPTGVRIGNEATFDVCFAENPRFALPESAFEMGNATEIFEADGIEIRA